MTIRHSSAWAQIVLWSTIFLGCRPAVEPPRSEGETEVSETETRVVDLLQVAETIINDNFVSNEIEPMEPYIGSDVTVFGPSGATLREGGEAMIESLRRGAETKTTHRWEERDWKAQVYDEVGIVTFHYDHDATRGGNRSERTSRATYVFHHREGRWTLVHDHTSVLTAPRESPHAGHDPASSASRIVRRSEEQPLEPERAKEEILEVAQLLHDEYAANRVDPFVPFIGEDVTVFGPGGTPRRDGGEKMIEGLRRGAANKTTHRWEERDWKVQVYGNVGIVTFIYDHDLTVNGERRVRTSRATYVFHRRDGRWVMVHDHTSPLVEEQSEAD